MITFAKFKPRPTTTKCLSISKGRVGVGGGGDIVSIDEALLGTMFSCGQKQYLSVVAKDVRGEGE